MGAAASKRPFPHNPLVGNRPMAYPVTLSARIAQFPIVFHWRYTFWCKPMFYSFFLLLFINYKIEKFVYRPSNVLEWHERRWGENGWYALKKPPEYDCY